MGEETVCICDLRHDVYLLWLCRTHVFLVSVTVCVCDKENEDKQEIPERLDTDDGTCY